MPKVYQAGPIDNAADHGVGWRNWLKGTFPEIEWVDPCEKEFAEAGPNSTWEERMDVYAENPEAMVHDDYALVAECDAMLVHWEEVPTCGTPMEMSMAAIVPPLARTLDDMSYKLEEGWSREDAIRDSLVAAEVPRYLGELVVTTSKDIPIIVQTTVDGYDLSYFIRTHATAIEETYEDAVRELKAATGMEAPA